MNNDYFDYNTPQKPKKGGLGGGAVAVIIIATLITGMLFGGVLFYAISGKNPSISADKTASPSATYKTTPSTSAPGITNIPQITAPPIDQSEPIVEIAEKLTPAVVAVRNYAISNGREALQGGGSGVIFTTDGYVITNEHVVDGAQKLTVVLSDKRELDAKLIGKDERTDLAVLKIEAEGEYTAAPLGNSSNLKVGQLVVAIGSPLGYAGTVTSGIVSAVDRVVDSDGKRFKMIQTDAAINPGNSGGPLFNRYGEVIGITSMKEVYTQNEYGQQIAVEGLGYAIPIDTAKPIIQQLMEKGKVERAGLGITCRTAVNTNNQYIGVEVVSVNEGGAADKAGIKPGDIIVKVDDQDVKMLEDLTSIMDTKVIGQEIEVTVIRNNAEVTLKLTLGTLVS